MRRLILPALLVSALAIAIACGGGDGDDSSSTGDSPFTPVPGNSELVVGPQRFAVALEHEDEGPLLGDAGAAVRVAFFYGEELRTEAELAFTWAIPDEIGFWTADVTFDQAGQWSADVLVSQDGDESLVTFEFPVAEESAFPNVGDAAIPSENLTLSEEPNIKKLSTSPDPEPAFYELTIAQALENDRPIVITFATPAFCETRFCGPVVENVKVVWRDFGEQVDFIHVEPFELDDEGQLVVSDEGGRVAVEATLEWRLRSEPWIFIVGADGTITKRFEGAASPDQIAEALEELLS